MRPVTIILTNAAGTASDPVPMDLYVSPFNVALGATAPFCDVI